MQTPLLILNKLGYIQIIHNLWLSIHKMVTQNEQFPQLIQQMNTILFQYNLSKYNRIYLKMDSRFYQGKLILFLLTILMSITNKSSRIIKIEGNNITQEIQKFTIYIVYKYTSHNIFYNQEQHTFIIDCYILIQQQLIYILLLINMIPIPKCNRSNQNCNKVCIHKDCRESAFICKECQGHACQKLHIHDENKLNIDYWQNIQKLTEDIQTPVKNKYILQMMQNFQKQIYELIDNLKGVIQLYSERIKQLDKETMMDPQFKIIWNKIKQKNTNDITGKQMGLMYDRLKSNKFNTNQKEIIEKKDKETKHVELLLKNIGKKLEQYIKEEKNIMNNYIQDSTQVKQIPHQIGINQQENKLNHYNKLIQQDPKNSMAYCNRAQIYMNRGQFELALDDYNKSIQYDDKNAVAYNGRGVCFKSQNKLDKALQDINKAIQYDPKYSMAYQNRAQIYVGQGQQEKALEDFNKAIQQNNKNSTAYNGRGNLYQNLNQIKKAQRDYSSAIQHNPNYSIAYYNRALLLHEKNNKKKALDDYNKAIECNPYFSQAYYNRGKIYESQNKLQKAQSDYTEAIKYESANSQYYNKRGEIYFKRYMFQEALSDFTNAIKYDKKEQYYRNRAKIYKKLSMKKQATADQKQANELVGL